MYSIWYGKRVNDVQLDIHDLFVFYASNKYFHLVNVVAYLVSTVFLWNSNRNRGLIKELT